MIAALALYECVPTISLTRPGRNQRAVTGQFWISSPHVGSPETLFSFTSCCFLCLVLWLCYPSHCVIFDLQKENSVCLCANLFYYKKRECNLNTNSGPEFCSCCSVHCVCALLAKLWNLYDNFSLSISWPATPNKKEAESGILDQMVFLYIKWVECFFYIEWVVCHIFAWKKRIHFLCELSFRKKKT